MADKYYLYNGGSFESGFNPVYLNFCDPFWLEGTYTERGFEWNEIMDPFLDTPIKDDTLIYECDTEEELHNARIAFIDGLLNFDKCNNEVRDYIKSFKDNYKGE